jgi:hypothetical protein
MSMVVYIFIFKIKIYKTEQKKLIVQFEKKIYYHLSTTELNIGSIQIVAHLKRFCLTHNLLKSYKKVTAPKIFHNTPGIYIITVFSARQTE